MKYQCFTWDLQYLLASSQVNFWVKYLKHDPSNRAQPDLHWIISRKMNWATIYVFLSCYYCYLCRLLKLWKIFDSWLHHSEVLDCCMCVILISIQLRCCMRVFFTLGMSISIAWDTTKFKYLRVYNCCMWQK